MKRLVVLMLVVILMGAVLISFDITQQQEKQNLTGDLTVKHSPNITSVELFDDEDGGTTTPTIELTPYDEMTIRINVTFIAQNFEPSFIYELSCFMLLFKLF